MFPLQSSAPACLWMSHVPTSESSICSHCLFGFRKPGFFPVKNL
uniref:Uncharacterized protein n=1 Tax=Rhizophora mucronata TaxID=61149 RepID=A0A2P2JHB7_RHIMU